MVCINRVYTYMYSEVLYHAFMHLCYVCCVPHECMHQCCENMVLCAYRVYGLQVYVRIDVEKSICINMLSIESA